MVTSTLGEMLEKAQHGDQVAENAVYRIAFWRLRSIASSLLRRETAAQTLQPTALVSELFLKLRRLESRILGEEHFFHISARAMRQVLVDHARTRRAQKKIPPELIAELLPDAVQTGPDTELRLTTKPASLSRPTMYWLLMSGIRRPMSGPGGCRFTRHASPDGGFFSGVIGRLRMSVPPSL